MTCVQICQEKKNFTINETTYLKVSKRLQLTPLQREYMDVKKAHTRVLCLSLPVSQHH